jgi:acyl carrier protein
MNQEELATRVLSLVRAKSGGAGAAIRCDMSFEYDLEMDSATLIDLIDTVEADMDIVVADEWLSRLYRVRDLVEAVRDAGVVA